MPKPRKNETRSDFVQRCVQRRRQEKQKEDVNQSIAICYSIWKKRHKKEKK